MQNTAIDTNIFQFQAWHAPQIAGIIIIKSENTKKIIALSALFWVAISKSRGFNITAIPATITAIIIKNISNFNPIKDEIYSILSDATDEELYLYRNVIDTIRKSRKLTTKELQKIKKATISKYNEIIADNSINKKSKWRIPFVVFLYLVL